MKTYRFLILGLMLPLANLTVACSAEDDDDAGDEQGDDSGPSNSSGGNSSGGNSSGGNSSGGNSSGGNSGDDSNDDDGGWDDGWDDDGDDGANDDGPSGGDIGDECKSDDDCSSRICLFSGNATFGFCSIVCDSWSDCPSFWDCVEVGNATRTYCAPS